MATRYSETGFPQEVRDYDPTTRSMVDKTITVFCGYRSDDLTDCTNIATIEYETPRSFGMLSGTFVTWRCRTHEIPQR